MITFGDTVYLKSASVFGVVLNTWLLHEKNKTTRFYYVEWELPPWCKAGPGPFQVTGKDIIGPITQKIAFAAMMKAARRYMSQPSTRARQNKVMKAKYRERGLVYRPLKGF